MDNSDLTWLYYETAKYYTTINTILRYLPYILNLLTSAAQIYIPTQILASISLIISAFGLLSYFFNYDKQVATSQWQANKSARSFIRGKPRAKGKVIVNIPNAVWKKYNRRGELRSHRDASLAC